jgi:hypothetical protein
MLLKPRSKESIQIISQDHNIQVWKYIQRIQATISCAFKLLYILFIWCYFQRAWTANIHQIRPDSYTNGDFLLACHKPTTNDG